MRTTYPKAAPTTSLYPNACVKIEEIAAGISCQETATTASPSSRYASAITGTIVCVTEAMRRTPPKTTSPVRAATTMPVTHGSHAPASVPVIDATAPPREAEIVLACSELNANGKQMMRITANHTPIQRALSPRCM